MDEQRAEDRDKAWAGIDIGKRHHWVCVVDADGRTLLSQKVANDEGAITSTIAAVVALAPGVRWAVDIIGAPSALVLALLNQSGQQVRYASGRIVNTMISHINPLAIQPKQIRTLSAVFRSLQEPALLLAVAGGHAAVARALIDAGASINVVAGNQDTPWLLAGALGRSEILRRMLSARPDLSRRNRFGGNALIPACERGHVEAARVLLTSGIDVDHVNNLGWTCLLEIVVLGDGSARHIEVARLVLDAGANPNIADRDGVTPLAHARRRGFSAIAGLIAAKGGRD